MKFLQCILLGSLLATTAGCGLLSAEAPHMEQIVWKFDRLDNIGGVATHVEGHPQLIATPAGKAVTFNGVDDALIIDKHPLAGASTFAVEAAFRPDGGEVGLAMVVGLMRALGGDVRVNSSPGRGSTFTFVLDAEVDL